MPESISIRSGGDNDKSALGEHYSDAHPDSTQTPRVVFRILAHAPDELRLKIKEAYWIKKKQPSLNRKAEEMGTRFLI